MHKRRPLIFALFVLLAFAIFIRLSSNTGAPAAQAASPSAAGASHKVIVGADSPITMDPEARLLHDYGSFALYEVTERAYNGLLSRQEPGVVTADEMDRLLIDAYSFNTQTQQPQLPGYLEPYAPAGASLQLIQFVGPIKAEWLKEVERAGAVPVHYIATNGYLVWATPTARERLGRLARSSSYLQYSALYEPAYKLGPTLRERLAGPKPSGEEIVTVVVQMYAHQNKRASERAIAALALDKELSWAPILNYQNATVTVRVGDLATLAALPDVYWIGEKLERELYDEVQGQILAGNFDASQTGPSGPGYKAWLDSYGFSTNPADYPIVDIADDGIGGGDAPTQPVNTPTQDSTLDPRVVYRISCHGSLVNDGRGTDGHGHINASIAVGLDERTGFPYEDADGFQRGLGINPYGRVGGTRIFGGNYNVTQCGGTDTGVIAATYATGARITNNSWGCSGCAATYDDSSQAYDVGTRDADLSAAGNQELIMIFAAGNSGSGATTVGSPGNGKNMITVGASENDRPYGTDGCNVGPTGANSAMDVINFSSRGPAPGNRIKPELIAPGTHIQGTASTHPDFNGEGVCGNFPTSDFEPVGQTVFTWSSGTSHSAPAVSGAASLYYWWLENEYGVSSPSPAMMKAYLIAHPTYLTGVGANDTLPSNTQGYGMPDMGAAFDDTPRYLVDQSTTFDNSGESFTFVGSVADPTRPVRIVLAYTDAAGAIGTNPQVNDLNLAAEVGGASYLGNVFTGAFSVSGGAADTRNNYEAIFLPAGTSGAVEVTVTAFGIGGDGVPNSGDTTDQDFALVCYNCAEFPDFTLQATPSTQAICAPDSALYTIDVGSIMGFNDPVTLSVSGQPAGSTTTFIPNPVTPPGSSILTIGNTGSASPGSYSLEVLGIAPTTTHTVTLGLDLYDMIPAAPTLLNPANGADGQPTTPLLSWSAVSQAASYTLEIATDEGFTNIIYSASGLTGTSHTPSALETATVYYWRVVAVNSCGTGAYSEVFTFSTVAAPGECAIGDVAVTSFEDDMESGVNGWTTSGVGSTWNQIGARVHSGVTAWHAVNPAAVSDQRLVSPPVVLPPASESPITLRFWNHQTMEDRTGGCFDGGILEYTTNSGATWLQVMNGDLITDPYNGPISSSFSNPLGGLQAWCGDPQDWLESVVDVSALAGETVSFRFRLGTDTTVSREGWYIDDVSVQSCQAAPTPTATATSTSTPSATATATNTATATATVTTQPATSTATSTATVTTQPATSTATSTATVTPQPATSTATSTATATTQPATNTATATATATMQSATSTATSTATVTTQPATNTATATATATATTEAVQVSIDDETVTEPENGSVPMTFTVSISSASSQPVTVDYQTVDDTAIAGEDYEATSGTVTFAPGETSSTLTVTILADETIENPEEFLVQLTDQQGRNLSGGTMQATGTIIDPGGPTSLELSRFAASVDRPAFENSGPARWVGAALLLLGLFAAGWQIRRTER